MRSAALWRSLRPLASWPGMISVKVSLMNSSVMVLGGSISTNASPMRPAVVMVKVEFAGIFSPWKISRSMMTPV
jgi:hypothetical protein